MNWLWNFLIWIDVQANDKWLGGRAETISGRCYKRQASGCKLCCFLCRMLDKVDPDHCRNSYFNDRKRNPDLPWV